jgi:hypothetical protein
MYQVNWHKPSRPLPVLQKKGTHIPHLGKTAFKGVEWQFLGRLTKLFLEICLHLIAIAPGNGYDSCLIFELKSISLCIAGNAFHLA